MNNRYGRLRWRRTRGVALQRTGLSDSENVPQMEGAGLVCLAARLAAELVEGLAVQPVAQGFAQQAVSW